MVFSKGGAGGTHDTAGIRDTVDTAGSGAVVIVGVAGTDGIAQTPGAALQVPRLEAV